MNSIDIEKFEQEMKRIDNEIVANENKIINELNPTISKDEEKLEMHKSEIMSQILSARDATTNKEIYSNDKSRDIAFKAQIATSNNIKELKDNIEKLQIEKELLLSSNKSLLRQHSAQLAILNYRTASLK